MALPAVAEHELDVRAAAPAADRAGAEQQAAQEGAAIAGLGRHRLPRRRQPAVERDLQVVPARDVRAGRGGTRRALPRRRSRPPAGRRSGRWRGRGCGRSARAPADCRRPTSSARRQHARAGRMRASSPRSSLATSMRGCVSRRRRSAREMRSPLARPLGAILLLDPHQRGRQLGRIVMMGVGDVDEVLLDDGDLEAPRGGGHRPAPAGPASPRGAARRGCRSAGRSRRGRPRRGR